MHIQNLLEGGKDNGTQDAITSPPQDKMTASERYQVAAEKCKRHLKHMQGIAEMILNEMETSEGWKNLHLSEEEKHAFCLEYLPKYLEANPLVEADLEEDDEEDDEEEDEEDDELEPDSDQGPQGSPSDAARGRYYPQTFPQAPHLPATHTPSQILTPLPTYGFASPPSVKYTNPTQYYNPLGHTPPPNVPTGLPTWHNYEPQRGASVNFDPSKMGNSPFPSPYKRQKFDQPQSQPQQQNSPQTRHPQYPIPFNSYPRVFPEPRQPNTNNSPSPVQSQQNRRTPYPHTANPSNTSNYSGQAQETNFENFDTHSTHLDYTEASFDRDKKS